MFNNWQTNSFDPRFRRFDPRRYLQPQIDMARLMRGEHIPLPPHLAHLPPDVGRLELVKDLAFAHGMSMQEGLYNETGDIGDIARSATSAAWSIPGCPNDPVDHRL